jgi:hypothetical protein
VVYLAGLVTEVLNGESEDGRCTMIRIRFPRQPDARLGDFHGRWTSWDAWKGRRLRSPMEYDARIGRGFDDQVSVPFGLSGLAYRLAREHATVGLP